LGATDVLPKPLTVVMAGVNSEPDALHWRSLGKDNLLRCTRILRMTSHMFQQGSQIQFGTD
jgi:hypothetical protein